MNVSPLAPPHILEKERGHCVPVWQYVFETSHYWNTSSWQMIAIKSPVHPFSLPSDGVSLGSSWELVLLHNILGIQWVTVWSSLPLNTVSCSNCLASTETNHHTGSEKAETNSKNWWLMNLFCPLLLFLLGLLTWLRLQSSLFGSTFCHWPNSVPAFLFHPNWFCCHFLKFATRKLWLFMKSQQTYGSPRLQNWILLLFQPDKLKQTAALLHRRSWSSTVFIWYKMSLFSFNMFELHLWLGSVDLTLEQKLNC